MCPFCRQSAPLVYRGVVPYCTACGRVRAPLTQASLNLAGKPAAVGGAVAHVAGWVIVGIGSALALGLGLLAYALFTVTAALAMFLPIEAVALIVGLLLVSGGKKLHRSGTDEQRDTRLRAVLALAQTRGGILTAGDVARATDLLPADAEQLLTELAKTQPDVCSLEVDDHGQIFYRFANAPWTADPRMQPHVRVAEDQPAKSRIIDAELIEEPAEQSRSERQAR